MADSVRVPLVSVYCMTYNHEKTIGQAIEGVVSQKTDFPFELIIHDDASTDSTAEIVMDYADRYPDMIRTVIQKENQFRNCNIIKSFIHPLSKGSYIAICEGDDYWTDCSKLQKQVDYMKSHTGCSMCFHAVEELHSDGSLIPYRPLKQSGAVSAQTVVARGGQFCPSVSLMFRRDVMDCWPEFRDEADVYDYPAQALAAYMGEVYYMDCMMGVYRFASDGSWTAAHKNENDYTHLKNETHWLELFDAYTNHEFKDSIGYHMAHLWFTEYRKTFDKSVKAKAKAHIKRLPFKSRAVFSAAVVFFSVFGKSANLLFEKIKALLLK